MFRSTPSVQRVLNTWRNLGIMVQFEEGRTPETVDESRTDAETERLAEILFAYTHWRSNGKKTYVIEPDLYELLIRTEVPQLPLDYLWPPVEAFYLVLPPNSIRAITPRYPEGAPVEGAMVVINPVENQPGRMRLMQVVLGNPADTEDQGFTTSVYSMAGEVFPEMTMADLDNMDGETVLDGERWIVVGVTEEDSIFRAVVNFCLYLQSDHPHLEPVPPAPSFAPWHKKLSKRTARAPSPSRVGHVRVGLPISERLAQFSAGEDPTSQGPVATGQRWRLSHQVWVRGHWRLQPVGEGRRERKVIWIKPYVKGPDFAETLRYVRRFNGLVSEKNRAPQTPPL